MRGSSHLARNVAGMTRFVKLYTLSPYHVFARGLKNGRRGISIVYDDAFAAYDRASALLNESQLETMVDHFDYSNPISPRPIPRRSGRSDEEVRRLHVDAYDEDLAADNLSAIVAIFADNLLQAFSLDTLKHGLSIHPDRGFGPPLNGIPFTRILRATTNSIRHVNEWMRLDLQVLGLEKPMERLYPPWQQIDDIKKPSEDHKRARTMLQHIEVIQTGLGYGPSWFLQEAQPTTLLAVVDGMRGSLEGQSYARFENAIVETARAIAQRAEALGEVDDEGNAITPGQLEDALTVEGLSGS